MVRDNDLQWINVVRWVYFAIINAEELGVSSRTIDRALSLQKPEIKRLVGTSGDFGEKIGLTKRLGGERHPVCGELRRGL